MGGSIAWWRFGFEFLYGDVCGFGHTKCEEIHDQKYRFLWLVARYT